MIRINNKSYELDTNNYLKRYHSKQQIVIGNTFSENMNHFVGWKRRKGGKFRRTAAYTIDIDGNIHQHYEPQYYSEFFGIKGIDEHIIPVLIENEGWLTKDIDSNEYLNYVGNIYNRKDDVLEKRWRDQKYWAPYKKEQIESTIILSKYLCETFGIPLQAVKHNTKFDGVHEFNGIVYKSNFDKHYSDLSPAWDCGDFKNKIELK